MIHHEASGKAAEKGLFSRRVSVRAHFGNRGTAEQAANAIGRHARTVHVSHASPFRPASPARREDEPSVRLLEPNWLAFGAGLAIGVAGLQLVFPGPLASVYVDIGPSTATDLIKAVFVITGLAVALGWLTSSVRRLLAALAAPGRLRSAGRSTGTDPPRCRASTARDRRGRRVGPGGRIPAGGGT